MAGYVVLEEAEKHIQKPHNSIGIFIIFVVFIALIALVAFGINGFLFNKIRKKSCGSAVTQTEGTVLFWVNIALAVISGILTAVGILFSFYSKTEVNWKRKYRLAVSSSIKN